MSEMQECIDLNARVVDAEEQGMALNLATLLVENFAIIWSSVQKLDRPGGCAESAQS